MKFKVLPVLITLDNENTGVFFGFDVNSGQISNWLIDESFDVDFLKKVVNSHFLISIDNLARAVTLRFCDEAGI